MKGLFSPLTISVVANVALAGLLGAGGLGVWLNYRYLAQLEVQPRGWTVRRQYSPIQLTIATMLTLAGPTWRHRCVTRIDNVSPNIVRVRVKVDYTVPDDAALAATGSGLRVEAKEALIVPLCLVAKRKLSDVELHDESGRLQPILTRADETELMTLILLTLWMSVPGAPEFSTEAVRWLHQVVQEEPGAAGFSFARLVMALPDVPDDLIAHRDDFVATVRKFVRYAHLFAEVEGLAPGSRHVFTVSFKDLAQWSDATVWQAGYRFARHIGAWATGRLPLIPRLLGSNGEDLQRALNLLADDLSVGRPTPPPGRFLGVLKVFVLDLWSSLMGLTSRLGITAKCYVCDLPTFWAQSEHLEVDAPPGVYFAGGRLRSAAFDAASETVLWHVEERVPRGSRTAHLYSSFNTAHVARRCELHMRALRRGWLLNAFICTAAITALLAVIHTNRDALATDGATVAAVALGAGAIGAVYLSRPDEHVMTSMLLEGPRLALGATALAALWSITTLAFGTTDGPGWTSDSQGAVTLTISATSFGVLALGYAGSMLGWLLSIANTVRDNLRGVRDPDRLP